MINRVVLHMNNRVYSFLNPYMRDNTLSTYADNSLIYSVKNILIMPSVSNKIASTIFNDIANSNFSPCKCVIYIGVGPTLNVKVNDITIELFSDFSVQIECEVIHDWTSYFKYKW